MPDFQFDLAGPDPIVFNLLGDTSSLTIGDAQSNVLLALEAFMRGDKGDPGPSGSIGLEIEQIAVNGLNTITVGVPFSVSATQLFINGLRQSKTSYFVVGQVVTLPPPLNCIAGDLLVFEYLPT